MNQRRRLRRAAVGQKLQRFARSRAHEQALSVPWQRLLGSRDDYVDWMEFYYWCRSIIDSCGRIPVSLRADLDVRCPEFLESERQYESVQKRGDRSPSLRLLAWIEDHFFAEAKNEGWFNAIRYYAAHDLSCLRVEAYWREFVRESKNAVCSFVPFQDWLRSAAQSDPLPQLGPKLRNQHPWR